MKGIETMPIQFMLVAIILLIVVGIGLWQIDVFITFNMQKNFKEDLVDFSQKIEYLRSTGDRGSVQRSDITIPNDYEVKIDIDNNKFIGNLSGEIYEVPLAANIIKVNTTELQTSGNVTLPGGQLYSFAIHYGNLDRVKTFTIVIE